MHAVVFVKQVPDSTEVRIDPRTNTLMREGVPSIINPYDAHAVEEAVRLKERFGGKVTVISMGPPQAREVLKRSISFGADVGVLVTDRAFGGSDTLATSYILSQALRKVAEQEPVDIVFAGKQAIDGDTAQVGPGIATRMGWPQLTYVMNIISVDPDKREIVVERKLEGGKEIVKARLPVLLTVEKGINELRYATFPNLLRAARYEVTMWGKDQLAVDPGKIGLKGSPTTVGRIFPPPPREGGEKLPGGDDNPDQVAALLADLLIKRNLIADR